MFSLRLFGIVFLLFSLILTLIVESAILWGLEHGDDGTTTIGFLDFDPTSKFGRLTLSISFPQTTQNAEITPSLDLLKYYVPPTVIYDGSEDDSLPAPSISGSFPASTTASDEIVFTVDFEISSSTPYLFFSIRTIFQTPISLTIEEGPLQDNLTTTFNAISRCQFGPPTALFAPLTVASVYDLATNVATLVLPRLDLLGFTEDWCLYIASIGSWTIAGVGGITATIEQTGSVGENVICFSNLPASYSSLSFQITFASTFNIPPPLYINTQLRSQPITGPKPSEYFTSHVLIANDSDGIPTPSVKLAKIEFAPERFPNLGQNNNIVRWVVTIFSLPFFHTVQWLPQLYFNNESFIAFCEVNPNDAATQVSATHQSVILDVREASEFAKPYDLHCYGSVSPYFRHRPGFNATSPWSADAIERSPYFANFGLNSAWDDSTQLDPVTLLPPKSQLPKATLTASSPSLVVSSTQILLQYGVVIKLPGYTNNFGIKLKLPKTSSFISALQTTTPTSLTSLTFSRTVFPPNQFEPVIGDIILSCQDISDSTFTIYLCQWLNPDNTANNQIDATTTVHISTPITLNEGITNQLEVKLTKYHRNSVQYGASVSPLPVFTAALTPPDITLDSPTIYGYPANHSPSATTIPLAFSQHATFTAPSVPLSAPMTTINPNRISMNFGTYSASNTAKVAVTYYSFTLASTTTTETTFTGVEHTISSTNVVSDTTLISSTLNLDPTKIYFIRVDYEVTTPTGTQKTHFVTEFFNIASSCMLPSVENISAATNWSSQCINGGECSETTGRCVCIGDFVGRWCDAPFPTISESTIYIGQPTVTLSVAPPPGYAVSLVMDQDSSVQYPRSAQNNYDISNLYSRPVFDLNPASTLPTATSLPYTLQVRDATGTIVSTKPGSVLVVDQCSYISDDLACKIPGTARCYVKDPTTTQPSCACARLYGGSLCDTISLPFIISGISSIPSPQEVTLPVTDFAAETLPSSPPSGSVQTFLSTSLAFKFKSFSPSPDTVRVTYYSFPGPAAKALEQLPETPVSRAELDFSVATATLPSSTPLFVTVHYIYKPTGSESDPSVWVDLHYTSDFFIIDDLCAASCENGGICDHTGSCLCRAGFTGEVCDIQPCSQCKNLADCDAPDVFDNQPTAIVGGECSCKGSWTGDLCDQPIACEAASQQQCKNKGYLTKLTGSTCDLTQDCVCVGNWSGATCATCKGLECKNGGRTSTKTCLCGCATGFLGDRCECRGVDSAITFHGYNQVMLDYLKQVAAAGSASGSLTQGYEFVLFHVASVLAELLAVDKQSILNIAATAVGPTPDGDDSNVSTQISFRIYYSCPAHNPALTQPQLTSSFSSNLLPNFVPHPTIQELFVFPSNVDDETTGTIVDVPDSLTDIELDSSEENTATNFSIPNISFFLFFLFFFLILASI